VSQLTETGLWQDLREVPEAVQETLDKADGFDGAASLLRRDEVQRIVATGNGAAYYVAHALWLSSLDSDRLGPPIVAVPGGLVAKGRFRWRRGDLLLAVSSSGEFRDVVEAVERGAPRPFVAITARPDSTIATAADARAVISTNEQRAVTHTQVFCAGVVTALAVWARAFGDREVAEALSGAAEVCERALTAATTWAAGDALDQVPRPTAVVSLGSGHAWTAALETALLLREVAGIPAEGAETREGATSSMFGLSSGHLVVSVGPHDDPLLVEAEQRGRETGAAVVSLPGDVEAPHRLGAIASFPSSVALSAVLGLRAGLDVDKPSWVNAYYATARASDTGSGGGHDS
jgi:fructoselysine-6-P-deglycase FrlB-like protein